MNNQEKSANLDKEKIKELISLNPDSRQYFFSKADGRWLDWLWGNGFLDVIKQKTEDPTRRSYRTPEINYLIKVSEKEPTKVTDIILAVPVSTADFNPDAVEGFLQICRKLPAQELKRVVKKIHDEGWVQLKVGFSDWGFEYGEMFKTLAETGDFESILVLAKAVLAVHKNEEAEGTSRRLGTDNPFYFRGLEYTRVFQHLAGVDENNIEEAIALVTKTMGQTVLLWGKETEDKTFRIYDGFHLTDVDFFILELGEKDTPSYRDDVKQLAALIKVLAKRAIGDQCSNAERVAELYNKYFERQPDSQSMWRLKLSVMSLCPEVFKEKLKGAFFRVFAVEKYYDLISGAEYQKALRAGFSALSENDRREYVTQVLAYFGRQTEEADRKWLRTYGLRILSSICSYLTEEEKRECEQRFGKRPDPAYEPVPSLGTVSAGWVVPRGPITPEEFALLPLTEIAQKLRTEWTPEKLGERNSSADFLNPIDAEGLGQLLIKDMPNRLQDYVINAALFFEPGVLDPHYTYSFFRGLHEILHGNKMDTHAINWDGVIALCMAINDTSEREAFTKGSADPSDYVPWISSWTGVHSAMTDVIEEFLDGERDKIDFPKYRDELFKIISYLLRYPDPGPRDEEIESAKMKKRESASQEYFVSDPFTMAINTVRGRAYQNLVSFVYQDGKKYSKAETTKISADVKEVYENILKNETTRAIMFMFGHYLASFYFRDEAWIQKLLPQIFPAESEKKNLYTAAWEGFLSANIYDQLFTNPFFQNLYGQGLSLTEADFPKQAHFKEPDELIADHLALAFIHFPQFDFEHDLFNKFWNVGNTERHKEFISFIGRYCISRGSSAQWIKDNNVDVEKIKAFWDWALRNCTGDELIGFGHWINVRPDLLNIKWLAEHVRLTLEKTAGYVEWEYGLTRLLPTFAKEAPEDALAILRSHLLEEVAKHEPIRTWPNLDNEVVDVLRELYKNQTTREGVKALINDLLPYRNGAFWGLKSIIEENG